MSHGARICVKQVAIGFEMQTHNAIHDGDARQGLKHIGMGFSRRIFHKVLNYGIF